MQIAYTINNSRALQNTSQYNFQLQGVETKEDGDKVKQDNANQRVLQGLRESVNKVKEQILKVRNDDTKSDKEKAQLVKELRMQLVQLNEAYTMKRMAIQKQAKEEKKVEEEKKAKAEKKGQAEELKGDKKEVEMTKAFARADTALKQTKNLKCLQAQMEAQNAFLGSQIEKDMSRGIDVKKKIEAYYEADANIKNVGYTITEKMNKASHNVNEVGKTETQVDKVDSYKGNEATTKEQEEKKATSDEEVGSHVDIML